jgi:hypothetical protein
MRRGATDYIRRRVTPETDSFWFLIRARGSVIDIVVRGTGFSHWVFSTGTIRIHLVVALIILGSCFWFYIIIFGFGLQCDAILHCHTKRLRLTCVRYTLRISFLTSEVWLRNRVVRQMSSPELELCPCTL